MEPLTRFQEDVTALLLRSIHVKSTLYCCAKMSAPWGFRVSSREVASFHIVTGGSCWLTVEGVEGSVLLAEGDLVILPHGHAHTMTDHPASAVMRLEDLVALQLSGEDGHFYSAGQGAVTTLVCGGFRLEDQLINPLLSLLPTFIHLSHQRGRQDAWLPAIVNVVKSEASMNQPAAEIIITRLSEILFLQAVRSCIGAGSSGNAGWFGALRDPEIGRALVLLQREPDEPWTVETLAKHLNVSRSAFSARFKQLVGEPPMHYLTRLRLTKAAAALRTQPATLYEVARSIGYDSEVAFSKAFKRYYGIAPGAYRQGRQALIEDGGLTDGHRTPQITELHRASSPAFEASPPRQRKET